MRRMLSFRVVWPLLILIAVVAGQTVRFELLPGSSGAVSLLDLALGVMAGGLGIRLLLRRQAKEFADFIWRHPVWKWSVIFLAWATLSLLLNAMLYTGQELLVASAYLGRLILAVSVLWFASFERPPLRALVLRGFLWTGAILVTLGFLQRIFVPDFRFMQQYGWDPHVDRLLSTFYDPNYFGIFLVLVMMIALSQVFASTGRRRILTMVLFLAAWLALYLTFSRSAWVAGAIATTGMAFRKDWKLSLLVGAIFVGSLFLPTRLGSRFSETANIVRPENNSTGTYQCDEFAADAQCDNSGGQRRESLRKGVELFKHHPIIGAGYNAYGYALVNDGVIETLNEDVNSAQGSDSSVLNIAGTTGLIGLSLAGIFLVKVVLALRRRFVVSRDWLAQGLLWFTLAWVAAATLNNSILYVLILVPWALLVGSVLVPEIKRTTKS